MKKTYIYFLIITLTCCCFLNAFGQNETEQVGDSSVIRPFHGTVDEGIKTEKAWRNTASVFTLSGDQLSRMAVGNLLNTLQGRIPGLTVVTGSGEPGYDDPTLYVRGRSSWNIGGNSLLVYLDGFQVDLGAISALSPYEVESVTLLKDAVATALYGLQGGAGVLIVKTKSGGVSDKTHITFHAGYAVQTPVELPNVMSAYDYTRLYNRALQNDNLPVQYPNPDLYKAMNDPFHPNVNWYDQVLKNTSNLQNYNLAFSGGGAMAKYYVLLNYMNHTGLYKNADVEGKDFGTNAKYSKINLKANVELQLSKNLSVQTHLTGITEDRKTPLGFSAPELFNNLVRLPESAFPIRNPDSSWGNSSIYDFNPVERLRRGGFYDTHTRTLQAGFTFNEKLDAITSGLALNGGVSFINKYVGVYQKRFTIPTYEIVKGADDEPVKDGNGDIIYKKVGDKSQSISDNGGPHWNRTTGQIGLTYDRSFGKHTFTGMVVARRQSYSHEGQTYQVHTQGLSGDITYDYDKRYIVDVSGAYNGASGFAAGHRYGFFPAVGLGWIISNEDFLKHNDAINFLKLRMSYGASGNINEDYQFLYDQIANGSGSWIVGSNNTVKNGMTEGPFANPDASWEEKKTFNVGVDLRLWKKLTATIDVFNEKRTGILENPSAYYPDFAGYSLQFENTGEVNNRGFEAVISYHGKANDFQYSVSGSASYAHNKILKKAEVSQPYNYLYEKGYPIDQMRGLVFDGFYQESDFNADGSLKNGVVESSYTNAKPGDLKFIDQDKNGMINDFDKVPLMYSKLPEITVGLNLAFKYKGFDFNAFIQGVTHRTVSLLDDAYNYTHPFVDHNNITPFSANSWTPQTAGTATTPILSTLGNANNDQSSDFWMRNGSFIKVRDIEIGYTLPKNGFLKNIESVRVSVIGTNLFTLDHITGLEAENLSMGYPLMKAFSIGLDVQF